MNKKLTLLTICLLLVLSGCKDKEITVYSDHEYELEEDINKEYALSEEAQSYYQFAQPEIGELVADIILEGGDMISIKLLSEEAPETVDTFIRLSNEGVYNGTSVNRIIQDYMVQIGDTQEGSVYERDEISKGINPFRGAVCLSNLGLENTNTGQFFIVQTKPVVIEELIYLLEEGRSLSLKEYVKESYHVELSDALIDEYRRFGGTPWITGRHTIFGQVFRGFDILDKLAESGTDERGNPDHEMIVQEIVIYEYNGLGG